MKRDFKLYLRLLGHARPYWRVAGISVLAMTVSAGLEPVLPALMQPLIDKSLIQRQGTSLWQVPVFIVVAFLLKGLADYVANVASQTVAQKTITDLRALIFSHQLDLPIARHRAEEGGRMLSRVTYDTSMVGEAVSTAWLTIIRDSLVLLGLLGFLFYTAWQLTLVVLLIAPALAFAIRRINGRLRKSSECVQGWMGRVTGLVEEALLGLQEIKIFGAHRSQAQRFDYANQGLRREQMRAVRVQAINVPLVQVLAASSVAVVIFVASSLSRQDLLTPGEFVSFITAMSMLFEPIRRLTNVNAILQRGLAAAESIFSLLDEKGEGGGVSPLDSEAIPVRLSQEVQPPPAIDFEQVSYRYPGSDEWSLENFSLHIRGGQSVTLVGPSGSGKSSLLYLLCGFDVPNQGKILINQKSVDLIPVQELRAQIALVGQQTVLFNLTIAENLRLAKNDATEAEMLEALNAADALDFVSKLPRGLHTLLGSLGIGLSGGQQQRISIARAFLKNAPIVLLDEPTSALDRDSESSVLAGLAALKKNRTVILVSHSPERYTNTDLTCRLC
jgi:subfamily B ATP-binding cassette protein MsbA